MKGLNLGCCRLFRARAGFFVGRCGRFYVGVREARVEGGREAGRKG